MLLTRTYTEINDSNCLMLNTEWTFSRGLRYACARLLAGAIILNTTNGEAIILNTVEAYGRETIQFENQPRLIIGTKSCNILITSSLRLDVKGEKRISLGATTVSIKLSDDLTSRGTRIFLDGKSINQANNPANDREAWTVDLEDQMTSLRQTRSHFDESTTYSLCRVSGPFTTSRYRQPFNIFTLATSDGFRSFGKIRAIATIFNEIAKEVLYCGNEGTLNIKFVQDAQKFFNTDKDDDKTNIMNKTALNEIIDLFGRSADFLVILCNSALNRQLEFLANSLHH